MIKKTVSYIKLIQTWTLVLIMMWGVVFINSNLPGKIIGYFFPVVKEFNFEVTDIENFSVNIRGSFIKLRSCSFKDINWLVYNSTKDIFTTVKVTFVEKEMVRIEGKQFFGPWRISISPENMENSEVYSVHQCYVINQTYFKLPFPWETITLLHPHE